MVQVGFETLVVEVLGSILVKNGFSLLLEASKQEAATVIVSYIDVAIVVVNHWRRSGDTERLEYCIVMFA